MYQAHKFIFIMKNRKYQYIFGFSITLLLLISLSVIADTTEDTAEAVEAAEPKKSPIKIGGAMRANYIYGTYVDQGRGEKIGDVDLEIFTP